MKKPKRVVLGTGHPWFFNRHKGGLMYTAVELTTKPVQESILLRGGEEHVDLAIHDVGNWNKCRLVLEILK